MDVSKVDVTGELYQVLQSLYVWETRYGNFAFEGDVGQYPRGIVRPHMLENSDRTLVTDDYTYPLYLSSDQIIIPNLGHGYVDTPQAANTYILPEKNSAFYLAGCKTTEPHRLGSDADPTVIWKFYSTILEPWNNGNASTPDHIEDTALFELFENTPVLTATVGV